MPTSTPQRSLAARCSLALLSTAIAASICAGAASAATYDVWNCANAPLGAGDWTGTRTGSTRVVSSCGQPGISEVGRLTAISGVASSATLRRLYRAGF